MADKKISGLPAATAAELTQLFEVTTNPNGTPASEKLSLDQIKTLLDTIYQSILSVPSSDLTGSGTKTTMTVDVNSVGFGAALHIDTDGNLIEADASSDAATPCQALALETGTGNKSVLLTGFIKNNTWSLTAGSRVYLSTTSGTFSHTAPSGSGEQVQVLGYAVSSTVLFFNPDSTTLENA